MTVDRQSPVHALCTTLTIESSRIFSSCHVDFFNGCEAPKILLTLEYTHTCMNIKVLQQPTLINTHTHRYTHTHIHIYMYVHTHICTHTHIYPHPSIKYHIGSYIYTYMYIHTSIYKYNHIIYSGY